ncbi:MAG TPA: hypothetical protein VJ258_02920 [Candidatus Limnocylindrales bacterium]|nr:hypothetical protein [Candidatus Limnocylindrales bacterium]
MDSPTPAHPARARAPRPETRPDYTSRALALWPRLEPTRLSRVRRDPRRVAALVSHRTILSRESILALLGAPHEAGKKRRTRN